MGKKIKTLKQKLEKIIRPLSATVYTKGKLH